MIDHDERWRNGRCRSYRPEDHRPPDDQPAEDTAWLVIGWVGVCVSIILVVLLSAYLWASGG